MSASRRQLHSWSHFVKYHSVELCSMKQKLDMNLSAFSWNIFVGGDSHLCMLLLNDETRDDDFGTSLYFNCMSQIDANVNSICLNIGATMSQICQIFKNSKAYNMLIVNQFFIFIIFIFKMYIYICYYLFVEINFIDD